MGTASAGDLLSLEMQTLWGDDIFGRPAPSQPLVALAVAEYGCQVCFGPEVSLDMRAVLEKEASDFSISLVRSEWRSVCESWRERLAPLGAMRVAGGPSYVFRSDDSTKTRSPRVLTSGDDSRPLAKLRPPTWGDEEEWRELLAGRLGPWAIAWIPDRVVSVCYTPVASALAAEAGIWTSPEERGRGWAPLTVAGWAGAARDSFQTLFYSTSFENTASQAVARKLGLRPIGDTWKIEVA